MTATTIEVTGSRGQVAAVRALLGPLLQREGLDVPIVQATRIPHPTPCDCGCEQDRIG